MRIARYPSSIAYFPLPRKKSSKVYSIATGTGKITLLNSISIPYGLAGRWALLGLSHLAMNKDGKVEDFSLYDLLKKIIGRKPSGKQLASFCPQMNLWINTFISIERSSDAQKSYKNLCLVGDAKISLKNNLDKDEHIFLEFSSDGKEFLSSNMLPIPAEIIHQIKMVMDFDALCWLISFIYLCQSRAKRSLFVSWEHIYRQFCIIPAHHARFRATFSESLRFIIDTFYKEARIERLEKGIIVYNAPLLTPREGNLFIPNSTMKLGEAINGNDFI